MNEAMPFFMGLRDVGLFVRSARTDARLNQLRSTQGAAAALEAVYAANPDPWAAGSPHYRYQRRKYEVLASRLPPRRFHHALDLGCGLGLLSRHLAAHADSVLGVDVAPTAIARARVQHADVPNLAFETHNIMALPSSLDGRFDLIMIADVLYYLFPLDDAALKTLSRRIAQLLSPGGICMLVNHYFFAFDSESRRSRRIHDAFIWSSDFTLDRNIGGPSIW
jgi:2-polyprenyl-3-methyl-5-hydroxy-6-metoxy-1,4-benzoquinol methylase